MQDFPDATATTPARLAERLLTAGIQQSVIDSLPAGALVGAVYSSTGRYTTLQQLRTLLQNEGLDSAGAKQTLFKRWILADF